MRKIVDMVVKKVNYLVNGLMIGSGNFHRMWRRRQGIENCNFFKKDLRISI